MTMGATTRVTVIIPTFNRAEFIAEAIESLLNQTQKAQQIIVSDDGSTDDTSSVVAQYGNLVTYVKNENGGKSKAINRVSHLIEGDFVWIFDDDDIAEENALASLLEPHLENSALDFSFGYIVPKRFRNKDDIGKEAGGKIPNEFSHESHLYNLTKENYIFLNSCLINRAKFERTLPFNEEMIRSQDYEFLVRLSLNAKIHFTEKLVFYLRIHDGIRGSQRTPIPYRLRSLAWEKYDKIVGKLVLDQYPDSAFLHPNLNVTSNRHQQYSIEIRKSYIAANKGLFDEAYTHLAKAKDMSKNSDLCLDTIDRENIESIFNEPRLLEHLFMHKEKMKKIFRIATLLASINPSVLASKRMYWSGLNALRDKRFSDASSLFMKSIYFLLSSKINQ